MSWAANHPESFGVYSTAVQEDRLFIEDGTVLRCDLFFSSAVRDDSVVAARGSRVSQSVPAFVWQYSGLLPVSDYLKTAAIHSAGSMEKDRAWQDVQLTFYEGLRAEGVPEFEAKVAYAGAYAFAPRWPLVEFIDITDPERDKDSRLYRVEYITANPKGISIDEYRSLVMDIEADTDDISLQDIRGVIDAADAARASSGEEGGTWLQRIWRNERPKGGKVNAKAAAAVTPASTKNNGNNLGMLFASEKRRMAEMKAAEEQAQEAQPASVEPSAAELPAAETKEAPMTEEVTSPTMVAEEGEVVEIPPADNDMPAVLGADTEVMQPESVADDLAAADQAILDNAESTKKEAVQAEVGIRGEAVDLDMIQENAAPPVPQLEQSKDVEREAGEWVLMPDGSEMLKL